LACDVIKEAAAAAAAARRAPRLLADGFTSYSFSDVNSVKCSQCKTLWGPALFCNDHTPLVRFGFAVDKSTTNQTNGI